MEPNKTIIEDDHLEKLFGGADPCKVTVEQGIDMVVPLTCQSAVPSENTPCWWKCRLNDQHIWFATSKTRTGERVRCPFCASSR